MVEDNQRLEALAKFRRSPAGFATQVLGITPQLHQVEILNSIRDRRRTLAISCNSIGKDFIAGVATHWWLQIWDEALVMTTAPTGEQVKNVQWKEIRWMFNRSKVPLGGSIPEVEPVYRISDKRGAFGLATRDEAERMQGHHEAHILIIITEGSAVPDVVFEGVRAVMASGDVRLLVLSNPTRNVGEVWEIAQGNRAGWNVLQYGGFDLPNLRACEDLGEEHMSLTAEELEERNECPNPTPYLLTHVFEAETREDFGEESDYYKVHVKGIYGETGTDQLIPSDWVEQAFDREANRTGPQGAGLDISRSGRDRTAYVELVGDSLEVLEEVPRMELPDTEEWVEEQIHGRKSLPLCVDDTGLGGGVAPHLAKSFPRVRGVDFSEKATDPKRFSNKPAEMYWRLRRALDPDGETPLSLHRVHPNLRRKLKAQLKKVTYDTNDPKQRLRVDKKGGGKASPDLVDALVLALEAQANMVWSGLRPQGAARNPDDSDGTGRTQFAGVRSRQF